MEKPVLLHSDAGNTIFHYVKNTIGQGILFSASSISHLKGFSNSNWAKGLDTRKSIIGFYMFLGDSLISQKSKEQIVVSWSLTEVKYRALTSIVCEVTWLASLSKDLGVTRSHAAVIYCDSNESLHVVANSMFHNRTQYIKIDCCLIGEKSQQKLIQT